MRDFFLLGFGALAALLGSLVQAFVTRMHARADRHSELLIDAYSEYLSGLADISSMQVSDPEKADAARARIIAGKQKIAAYAPARVVLALAALERTSLQLSDASAQKAMIELVGTMRTSVGVPSKNLETAIRDVLFSAAAL